MSLLFIDGSEHYNSSTILEKYSSGSVGSVSTLYGRHDKGLSSPNITLGLNHPPVGDSHFILGGAVRPTSLGGVDFFGVIDIGTLLAHVDVLNNGAMRLNIFGDDDIRSDPDVMRVNNWYFLEFKGRVTFDPAGGPYYQHVIHDVTIRVDGETVLLVTGEAGRTPIQLVNDASEFFWDTIFRGGVVGGTHQDDFYVCDGAGSAPFNDFIGDHRIGVIYPDGAGATTEWQPSGASPNWQCVNDTDADDGDATYVTASGDGLLDLYELEDVDTNNTLKAIQVLISAKRASDGFAFLTPYLRQGGVNYTNTPRALANTYFYRNRDVYEVSPSGGAWNDSILNALQAGFRRGEF